MRTQNTPQPHPTPRSWEPGQGSATLRWLGAAGSAFAAGAFVPEVAADAFQYVNDMVTQPMATARLPDDFSARATIGGLFTFSALWLGTFAIQAGRQPREGAPLAPDDAAPDAR